MAEIQPHSNFTDQRLFENQDYNVICNRIIYNIQRTLPEEDITASLALTGTVSKIIQGAPLTPVEVTPFITNSTAIFSYASTNLPADAGALMAQNYKNVVQLTFTSFLVELHFTNDIKRLLQISGFTVQHQEDIPTNIR